jgi:catechol 2,3-dioxygenase-like lactoylglutathione lyase family enzyme
MAVVLNQFGQVSLSVDDVDAAEEFYGQKLGLRKLYRFGDLGVLRLRGCAALSGEVTVGAFCAERIGPLLSNTGHHRSGP